MARWGETGRGRDGCGASRWQVFCPWDACGGGVISPSKARHECSRSVDASRAALRRPEVREHFKFFFLVPPLPSELSVDEHAELLVKVQ